MGIIHGLTNLGGAFLTIKMFASNLNKYEQRVTIAVSYLTFALFQLFTILLLVDKEFHLINNLFYFIFGLSVFFITNQIFFDKITNKNYEIYFAIFMLITGIFLILKG